MNTLAENLEWLRRHCKASVHITFNDHTPSYHSVADEIACRGARDAIPDDVYEEMCRLDTMVDVQAYPDTPIGSYSVFHHDVEAAVAEMRRIIERTRAEESARLKEIVFPDQENWEGLGPTPPPPAGAPNAEG